MGIASMVIGILAALLGFIPFCNYFALIPAVVGLVLGIVDVAMKSKKQLPKGISIAGVVLNAIAITLILVWSMAFASAVAAATTAAH